MMLRMVLPCFIAAISAATFLQGDYFLGLAFALFAAFLLLVALLMPDAL